MHHEIRATYQDLGKGPEGRYQNIEQLHQITFLSGLVHETTRMLMCQCHYTSPLEQWLPRHPPHLRSRSGPFCQTHGDGFPEGGGAGEGEGGAGMCMREYNREHKSLQQTTSWCTISSSASVTRCVPHVSSGGCDATHCPVEL